VFPLGDLGVLAVEFPVLVFSRGSLYILWLKENSRMFKRVASAVFALSLVACSSEPAKEAEPAATPPPPKPAAAELWNVAIGIETPESVYVDPKSGEIYVSIIAGMPGEKDGNGRIAKISADGKSTNASWADGMNAPKGLRSHEGTLWTADIDEIIGLDMATGKATSKVKVPGAQFLNDVATGADGTVYVSDMMGNKIYTLKGGKVGVFAEGAELLEYPNGLLVEGDSLVVGSWGKPEADFTTKVPGRLFKLDLKTKKKTLITPDPVLNIDGLESDGSGGYIVSDYLAGKIIQISSDGKMKTLTTFMPSTADIAYVAGEKRLLVPHMNENKIVAYDISGALEGAGK
jgi:sugar lactone lactonase YvrE